MVVCAHSLGLEERRLLQSGNKAKESPGGDHTQQQEPSLTSSNDLTTKATTGDYIEDLIMRVTVDFMQRCKQVYSAKATVLHSVDPCMQKLDFAIHIWMLKIAGIIPGKWSSRPMDDQIKAGAHDE